MEREECPFPAAVHRGEYRTRNKQTRLFENKENTMNFLAISDREVSNGTFHNGASYTGAGSNTATLRVTTLEQAGDAVQADDTDKWDITVRRNELLLKDGHLAFPAAGRGEETRMALSPWATGQLCMRLGIPVAYFRKCPTILQDQQTNYWLRHQEKNGQNEDGYRHNGYERNGHGHHSDAHRSRSSGARSNDPQWFLRAKHNTIRAVLTEHYSPLDNALLMESLMPMLGNRYAVDWCALSPESLHLRLIDPRRTREILPNDALTVGVHIANSEVGFRSVTVDALVYRLVCSNGMVRLVKGKSLLRQRHIHLDRSRFRAALEEAVSDAFLTADGFIDELRRKTQQLVPDVEETIERLGERWKLSELVQEGIKSALARDVPQHQESLYGLVNAFTATAQQLSDEARYDLEVLAGRLAEHGVAAYAPRRSVVALAKEMFDAEIVRPQAAAFPRRAPQKAEA
jgi:hypothetical protein